ncbi:GreA/GreB family elongation factor [Saccharicrinis fermentans]|uniref:Regulator of nucleoside diphosphate kinase n=1 Tax=Saccharicrinis fermentans DSM 9555 = JCM 21142 TaxID=869213 RepID=W7XX35_9BACT|nr:GreA/GreB family elongation factor [Saccharicrinis fermentans]GAF03000.1 regulator of nucleoside diphosphate kinase [Saccharicrinis fermentans DSM 9555 = JCM 21142]
MEEKIKITELDYARLSSLVGSARNIKGIEHNYLEALAREIKRAEKVDSHSIEPEYVTMNSVVQVENVETKKRMTVKVVYPKEANFTKGYVSVFSPLGSALLGYKIGDSVQFEAPKGIVTVKILSLEYQPEANGAYTV